VQAHTDANLPAAASQTGGRLRDHYSHSHQDLMDIRKSVAHRPLNVGGSPSSLELRGGIRGSTSPAPRPATGPALAAMPRVVASTG
jgi:hypothetical protein